MSVIMGLDPSTSSTGYFLFESDNMTIIDYGTIPNKRLEEKERILNIYNTLTNILKKLKLRT